MLGRPDSNRKCLSIERVANGWMIGVRDEKRGFESYCTETFVAKNPDDLSQIIFEWAKGQQEKQS